MKKSSIGMKAPKGMHKMPMTGKLMKNSDMPIMPKRKGGKVKKGY